MPIKNAKTLVKKVEVREEFYKIFNEDQIVDIINDLVFKRQIKLKYGYFQQGAKSWDDFYFDTPITKSLEELRTIILNSIFYYVRDSKSVNLIDIGPGNGYPVKFWLEELNKLNILNKYVSVDISDDINEIVKTNISKWFPNLELVQYNRDIEFEEISRVVIENKMGLDVDPSDISNVVVHFGNTICNHDDRVEVLKNLGKSMDINDLLLFSYTTDKESNSIKHKYITDLQTVFWIPKLLGIELDKCLIETTFDEHLMSKIWYIELDCDYEIIFNIFGGYKKVNLFKGDKIHIWRHYLVGEATLRSELDEAELELILHLYDKTRSNAIVACRTKDHYNQR